MQRAQYIATEASAVQVPFIDRYLGTHSNDRMNNKAPKRQTEFMNNQAPERQDGRILMNNQAPERQTEFRTKHLNTD